MAEKYVNSWLDDPKFIENMFFDDKYYLQEYCRYMSQFLRRLPIPVSSTWDHKIKSMDLYVGSKKKSFRISSDIPIYEAGILIDTWAQQFYPKYTISIEKERPLTETEITIGIRDGLFSLDDAFNQIKKAVYKESGVITRIHLVQDEFKLTVNDESTIRFSKILLSKFLQTLKSLRDEPRVMRDFIMENSSVIKVLSPGSSPVEITHKGNRMKNFFIIHKDYLNLNGVSPFIVQGQEDSLIYKSGKFLIRFETLFHRDSCLELLKQESNKLVITD